MKYSDIKHILQENYSTYKCNSLSEAIFMIQDRGLKVDRCYQVIFFKKDYWGGIEKEDTKASLHYYLNDGDDLNIATFTPDTDTLSIGLRKDGTPLEKRRPINIDKRI